jgi:hypothetical protein
MDHLRLDALLLDGALAVVQIGQPVGPGVAGRVRQVVVALEIAVDRVAAVVVGSVVDRVIAVVAAAATARRSCAPT